MYNNYKKFLQLFIILLLCSLAGCTVDSCVEPDDFGYGQRYITVQSNPNNSMIHSLQQPGPFVPEYADWSSTNLTTNGEPILLAVINNTGSADNKGRYNPSSFSSLYSWTAWFGSYQQRQGNFFYTETCAFSQNVPCPCDGSSSCGHTNFGPVTNAPCIFTQGQGALALLMPVGTNDPNTYNGGMPPGGTIYHLALGSTNPCPNPGTIIEAGAPAGGLYLKTPPSSCANGCKLYVKMIDQLYEDNYGGYAVAVKSGFSTITPGALVQLVTIVQTNLCQATKAIYKNLIGTLGYLRVLLVLYVAFSAIGFLIGTVEITQKELFMRILKMALVIQISTMDSSWNFFNNYFFNFFTQGIGEILDMMAGNSVPSGASGSINQCVQNVGGFSKLDSIVHMFFSTQTFYKVTSLLFTSFAGFLFFPIFYVVAALSVYAIIKAVIMYLVCYTIISVLIILAPIFIPFILFKITRSMFDNWLKYLMSFFIQPIVIIAFAFFICDLVLNQMYYILGVRMCYMAKPIPNFCIFGQCIYLWQPAGVPTLATMHEMVVPGRICKPCTEQDPQPCQCTDSSPANCQEPVVPCCGDNVENCTTGFYGPYQATANRYVDAPYLDPASSNDMSKLREMQGGTYVDFTDVAVFALLAWVMFRLIDLVPAMARQLAGTPYMMTKADEVGNAITSNVWSMANTVASYGATTVARSVNTVGAYSTSRAQGLGRYAALEKAMSAGYNTKKFDVGTKLSKGVTTIQERLQDGVFRKIESAQNILKIDEKLQMIKPITDVIKNPLSAVARGAARALTMGVIPATGQILSVLGNIAAILPRKGFAAYRGTTSPGLLDSIKNSSKAVSNVAGKLDKGLTYFIGEYARKIEVDDKGIAQTNADGTIRYKGLPEIQEAKSRSDLRTALRSLADKNLVKPVLSAVADKTGLSTGASILGHAISGAIPEAQSNVAKFGYGIGRTASSAVGSMARNLCASPLLSGALKSMANVLDNDADKAWRKNSANHVNALEEYQDKIGGLIENFLESKAAKYSHAVFGLTGGAFGKDANEEIEGTYGMSRADYIRAQHETNLQNWEEGLIDTNAAAWNNPWGLAIARTIDNIPAAMNRSVLDQRLTGPAILRKISGSKTIDEDYEP